MIYVIGAENCWLRRSQQPFCKIGTTIDIRQRLAKAQTDNPLELKVHYLFTGGEVRERELHEMFRAWHYRGEWFRTWTRVNKTWWDLKPDIDAEWVMKEAPLLMANRGVVA